MRKYIYSTISFVIFAIPIIFLIYELSAFRPDGFIVDFIHLIVPVEIIVDTMGYTYSDLAPQIYLFLMHLNIALLILSYIYTIALLLISDLTKISIHWLIKSGMLAGLIILINYYFLSSSLYSAADLISAFGAMALNLYTVIYYLVLLNLIFIINKLFR